MEELGNDNKAILNPYETAIGDILGIINCLKRLGNIDEFLAWMDAHCGLRFREKLLEGYKFAIDTLVRMLCKEIANNYSLRLSEDDIFSRARFTGISVRKLPNTCEKSIILRNINSKAKVVLGAKEWQALKVRYSKFLEEVLLPLDNLKRAATASPQYRLETIDAAIHFSSMFQIYIFLNDTQRGLPHGYIAPMFEEGSGFSWVIVRKRKDYLNQVFEGYKYAVQFLWHYLLRQRFDYTSVARLHEAGGWAEFDKFFELIRSEIINPLESETDAHLGFDTVIMLQEPAKHLIGNLIDHGPPEARLSEQDLLERLFLWYEIELIDGSDFDFSGVAAFIPMLIGLVERKKELEATEKVQLIRLIHGSPIEHRRDYSYAVLVELYGTISDYSGWILFYDCCSDAGSTSPGYELAEEYIGRYLKDNLISVAEWPIDKKRFLKLMRNRLVSLTKEQMYGRWKRKR